MVTDEAQFTLLKDFILPAIQSGAALPENAGALTRLEAAVEAAAWPQRPVSPLPAAGRAINGKPITVRQAVLGTWAEYEINLTIDGDQVILFQRNVVDGGGLVRIAGHVQ